MTRQIQKCNWTDAISLGTVFIVPTVSSPVVAMLSSMILAVHNLTTILFGHGSSQKNILHPIRLFVLQYLSKNDAIVVQETEPFNMNVNCAVVASQLHHHVFIHPKLNKICIYLAMGTYTHRLSTNLLVLPVLYHFHLVTYSAYFSVAGGLMPNMKRDKLSVNMFNMMFHLMYLLSTWTGIRHSINYFKIIRKIKQIKILDGQDILSINIYFLNYNNSFNGVNN